MSNIDRRQMLAMTGATGLAAMLPGATVAFAKPQTTLKAGTFEVSTYTDGHLVLPIAMTAGNVDTAQRDAVLAALGQTGPTYNSPINVTLVRSGDEMILIDVGSGSRFMPTAGRLGAALESAGIDREKITRVVYTHAHPDHIWGSVDDFDELSFPKATHYVAEAEWKFWTAPDAINNVPKDRQSFVIGAQRNLKAIKERIKMVKPGDDIITGIHLLSTPGHTQGHVSVQVGTGNDRIVVLGDALTHPVISFEHPEWKPASDHVPDLAIKTRKALLAQLAADKTRFIGYHLPPPGVGIVEKKGTGYRYAPAA